MGGTTRGATEHHSEATYTALLDAAERCFTEFGVGKTSMGDIARAAELSRPTLYRYFPDRHALSLAVVMRRAKRLTHRAQAFIGTHLTLADQIVEGLIYIVDHGRRDSIVLALVAKEGGEARDEAAGLQRSTMARQITAEVWVPVLTRARHRGELRTELSTERACEWLLYVQIMLLGVINGDGLKDQRQARRLIREFVLPALVNPPLRVSSGPEDPLPLGGYRRRRD